MGYPYRLCRSTDGDPLDPFFAYDGFDRVKQSCPRIAMMVSFCLRLSDHVTTSNISLDS